MKEIVIIGASGFGREVAWLIERINSVRQEWSILGFIDDDESKRDLQAGGYSVIGDLNIASEHPDAYYVCAIGAAEVRRRVLNRLETIIHAKYATLLDPSVIMSDRIKVGAGSIICAGTIVTVDVTIGKHVIINLDCTVGHDAVIDDYVTLYPSVNVSGITHVCECAELGTGVQIIQGKSIGNGTIVGAGAVVVKDLPCRCTAVGSPAKPIKFLESTEKSGGILNPSYLSFTQSGRRYQNTCEVAA